ncbi:Hsp70 family protein [Dactylosporangium sp. NBC_01737]|uniref:Hsp70 family protein n=1 Tax=Dactylosporangium sp. NBC_01737 TaxID=2975959 RepID=UPI002E130FE5|nr:Hsp70 family protein [Dactylosporangium sp. NBC_01737]
MGRRAGPAAAVRLVTGRDALNAARVEPSAHEQHPKRRINEVSVLLGEREHDIAELVAATLRSVVDEAVRVTGAPLAAGTVLTHPAAWGTIRKDILLDAAARAGLADPVLVPEPVAAATYFMEVLGHDLAPGRSVVIYDLGAGTFDATVVRRGDEGLDILAADGLDELGGLDFDALVVTMVGAQAKAAASTVPEGWERLLHPQTPAERRFARLLWDDARAAKETLSRLPATGLSVPSLDLDAHLTRQEFEVAARPLVARTVRATAAVLRAARVPAADVAGLFLVGGSTRIPLVATLLFQELGIQPVVLEQPETVVAEGAQRWVAK